MATPPNREQTDANRQNPKKPLNWGWIALGGCLGLLLVLSPFILMVLGMAMADIQMSRVFDRTPEASEVVCHEVAPAVVARIEAGLTVPGGLLREARAVHADRNGLLGFIADDEWYIAADVQGDRLYPGERDIAVWRLRTRGNPRTGEGAPEAPIATIEVPPGGYPRNARADEAFAEADSIIGLLYPSNFPQLYTIDSRPDLADAAEACVAEALPELPKLVCQEVAPAVVARIEAGLTVPGGRLRRARAVHSDQDAWLWFIAADVQGGEYEGDRDIGVWRLTTEGDPEAGTVDANDAIAAANPLAAAASDFLSAGDPRLTRRAANCAILAVGRS